MSRPVVTMWVDETIQIWSKDGKLLTTSSGEEILRLQKMEHTKRELPLDVQCGICHKMVASDLFPDHAKIHADRTAACLHIGQDGNDRCSYCGLSL